MLHDKSQRDCWRCGLRFLSTKGPTRQWQGVHSHHNNGALRLELDKDDEGAIFRYSTLGPHRHTHNWAQISLQLISYSLALRENIGSDHVRRNWFKMQRFAADPIAVTAEGGTFEHPAAPWPEAPGLA